MVFISVLAVSLIFSYASAQLTVIPVVQTTNSVLTFSAVNIPCTDSDSGKNYFVKGRTIGRLDGTRKKASRTDTCKGSQLTEYYCGNGNDGNLFVMSATFTCPNGCKRGICLKSNNKIIILKETEPNEFFTIKSSANGQLIYRLADFNVLKRFYEVHGDSYDFLVVFPQARISSNYSRGINNYKIQGIGLTVNTSVPYTSRLLSFDAIDLNSLYSAKVSMNQAYLKRVILHEIGHTWCCYANGIFGRLPSHWTNNLDLFSGDTTKGDAMGYFSWIIKNGQEYCVNGNSDTTITKFSKLTQYLMGIIDSNSVPPIQVQEFEKKAGNTSYNTWGPTCFDNNHNFTNTFDVTINDVIDKNGKRVPDFNQSQKDFTAGFVIVVPYNSTADQNYVGYVTQYMNATPIAWSEVTDNHSTIQISN